MATYTITYNNVFGLPNSNPVEYTEATPTVELSAPEVEFGYVFNGWYDAPINGTLVTEIPVGSTGDITLYAIWNVIAGFVPVPIYGPGDQTVMLNSESIIDVRVNWTVKNNENQWHVLIHTLLGKYYLMREAGAPFATKEEALEARDNFIALFGESLNDTSAKKADITLSAENTTYDNTETSLVSENMQDAFDELYAAIDAALDEFMV